MLCTLFHSLLSSLRKSLPASSFAEKSLLWWYRILTPPLLLSGAACCGKKKRRESWVSSHSSSTSLLGDYWKIVSLFGLSFLLVKLAGVGTWIPSSIRPALLGAEMQWAPSHASDSVPGAEEAATNTRKPPTSEGFHFSAECSPCPCLWRAHPSFLKQSSPLSPFLHPNYSPTLANHVL